MENGKPLSRKLGASTGVSQSNKGVDATCSFSDTHHGLLRVRGWAQLSETERGSLPPRELRGRPGKPGLRRNISKRAVGRSGAAAATLLTLSAVLGLVSCTGKPERQKPPCGAPTPAFRLEASALDEPLPAGLTLTAEFGGAQSESYHVGDEQVGEVACCMTVAHVEDAPHRIPCSTAVRIDAAAAPNVIVCDLWTNGAVNLTVTLGERTLVEQTLQAKLLDEDDECGQFETLPARWVLGEMDAGVLVNGY